MTTTTTYTGRHSGLTIRSQISQRHADLVAHAAAMEKGVIPVDPAVLDSLYIAASEEYWAAPANAQALAASLRLGIDPHYRSRYAA